MEQIRWSCKLSYSICRIFGLDIYYVQEISKENEIGAVKTAPFLGTYNKICFIKDFISLEMLKSFCSHEALYFLF